MSLTVSFTRRVPVTPTHNTRQSKCIIFLRQVERQTETWREGERERGSSLYSDGEKTN